MQTGVRGGMQTLTQALADLHRRGLVDPASVPPGAVVGDDEEGPEP